MFLRVPKTFFTLKRVIKARLYLKGSAMDATLVSNSAIISVLVSELMKGMKG
jgi:hypothetical protein